MINLILVITGMAVIIKTNRAIRHFILKTFFPRYIAPPYYVTGFRNKTKAKIIRLKIAREEQKKEKTAARKHKQRCRADK